MNVKVNSYMCSVQCKWSAGNVCDCLSVFVH